MTSYADFSNEDLCAKVWGGIDQLGSSTKFAMDMVGTIRRKGQGASEKQRHWLERFAAIIDGEAAPNKPSAPARQQTAVGDFAPIMALFDKARSHLKRPAVVLNMAGMDVRLSVASDQARVPGSINVVEIDDAKPREGAWFGRILKSGVFEASPRVSTPQGLIAGLQRFAADPAGVAAEHGRLTGRCCFCNRTLDDPRSTAMGYGPVCAENFGLEWGEAGKTRKTKRAGASRSIGPAMGAEDELPF